MAQHRSKQGQPADAPEATKLGELFTIELDRQVGDFHGDWIAEGGLTVSRIPPGNFANRNPLLSCERLFML
jgi:hypothetical protein